MNKIVFLINSLSVGGKERQLAELLKSWKNVVSLDYEIIVLHKGIEYSFYERIRDRITFLNKRSNYDPKIFFSFWNQIRKGSQVFHTWDFVSAFYVGVLKFFYPKIIHINGAIRSAPPYETRYNGVEKFRFSFIFRFSDIIISNSYAGLKSYKLLSLKKCIIIHNGFNLRRMNIKKTNTPSDLDNLPKNAFKVIMVANFTKVKDYHTFVNAAEHFHHENENIYFISIGQGPNLKEFKQNFKHLNNLIFLGYQSDIEALLPNFNAGVLMSNPNLHGEGISNSIMEYMAAKLPVIAANNGGNNEIIDHGKTGFLISCFDTQELVNNILFLKNNPDFSKTMGEMGFNKLKQDFSYCSFLEGYQNVYTSLELNS